MIVKRENKFGYKLDGTEVVLNDTEAKLVQDIFHYYIDGLSASQILKMVVASNIRYYANKDGWSRSIIITILQDETYKGTEEYPQIVTPEIFDNVRKLSEKKSHKKDATEQPYIKIYKDKMKCAVCGDRIERRSGYGNVLPRFHCKNKSCEQSKSYIKQNVFENYIKRLFNQIADGDIDIEYEADMKDNAQAVSEIKKKTNELRLHMQDIDKTTDDILEEIETIASMRFDAYEKTDNSAQTKFIVETLQKENNNDRVSAECIDKVVKRILIEPDMVVTITMVNGKKFMGRMRKK